VSGCFRRRITCYVLLIKEGNMLKGIPRLIGPELLRTLHEMGHGDRLLLADAHFPAHTMGQRVLRADGLLIAPLLADILVLLELDQPANPLAMMQVEPPDEVDTSIEADYLRAIRAHYTDAEAPLRLAREDFYERARRSFAILVTGDTRPYGNLMLTKGVTPP
jgi:L-fucose mutarotase